MDLMSFMETMGASSVSFVAAFFIGLMMAISPCPLATNITAIAYVSKRIENGRHTLLVGLFYTIGRMLTYILLASLVIWVGLSTRTVSLFLQDYGEKMLGPFLMIMGVLMFGIVKISLPNVGGDKLKERLSEEGLLGSFLLGVLFALAFCPFSAVLFFGMLIPLCLSAKDSIILPSIFAFATGLPVIVFSFLLVSGVSKVGRLMNKLSVFEKAIRKTSAIIFIAVGIYYLYTMPPFSL